MAMYVWSSQKLPYTREKSMIGADMAVRLVHTHIRRQRLHRHVPTGVVQPEPRFAVVQARVYGSMLPSSH
jgi:hypothetical protein